MELGEATMTPKPRANNREGLVEALAILGGGWSDLGVLDHWGNAAPRGARHPV